MSPRSRVAVLVALGQLFRLVLGLIGIGVLVFIGPRLVFVLVVHGWDGGPSVAGYKKPRSMPPLISGGSNTSVKTPSLFGCSLHL